MIHPIHNFRGPSPFFGRQTEVRWPKSHSHLASKHDLEKLKKILLMKTAELAAALDTMTVQQGKIAKEQSDRFDAVTKALKDLTDSIANADVDPTVVTSLTALQAAADALDAAIPDAPVV